MDFVVSFCSGSIQRRKAGFQAALRSLGSTGAGFGQHLGSIRQYFRKHLGRIEILIKHIDLGTV